MPNYIEIISQINQLDARRKQLRVERVSLISNLYEYRSKYPTIFSDLPGNPDNIEPEDIEVVLGAIKYRVRNSAEVTEKDRIESIKLIDEIGERVRVINSEYDGIDKQLTEELGPEKLRRENYLEVIHQQTEQKLNQIKNLEKQIQEYEQGLKESIEKGLEEEIIKSFENTILAKQTQIEKIKSDIRDLYSEEGLQAEMDLFVKEKAKIENQKLEQLEKERQEKLTEEKRQHAEAIRRKNAIEGFENITNDLVTPSLEEDTKKNPSQQTTGNDKSSDVTQTIPGQHIESQINRINNFEYELDKEATMQEYRNSGYGQNAFGWYFNPNTDEYEENYNPLNDPLFQIFNEYELVNVLDEEATMQEYRNSGYRQNAFKWYFNPNTDEYEENYNPLNDPLFQKFKKERIYKGKKKGIEISNLKPTIDPIIDPVDPIIDPVDPIIDPVDPIIDPVDPIIDPVDPIIDPIDPQYGRDGKDGRDGRDGRDGNWVKYTADELVGDVPIPVTRKVWNWVKKNKNKIIITAGLATIAAGVYIKSKNYQEAKAAVEAAKLVADNTQIMVDNANLWHLVNGNTQPGLHAINQSIAQQITKLTGDVASYTPQTGVWEIGGQGLSAYAQAAGQKLAGAQQVLDKLIKTTSGLVMGGLGGTAFGVVLPNRKRTEAYTKINDAIRVYNKKYKELDEKDIEFLLDLQQKLKYVEDLKKEEAKLLQDKINEVVEKWKEFTRELDEQIIREKIENTESAEEEMIMEEYEEEGPTRSGGRR